MDFKINENGVMRLYDRVCMPNMSEFKRIILEEGHMSDLCTHPDATKMYQDLKIMFCCLGMKKNVAEFVYSCLVCQKSKNEHQKPSGLMQPLSIPKWKWDSISMDFVTIFPKTSKGSDKIWVVVDMLTKSSHFILIKINYPLQKLDEVYIEKIVYFLGIPSSLVSDRDIRFTGSRRVYRKSWKLDCG